MKIKKLFCALLFMLIAGMTTQVSAQISDINEFKAVNPLIIDPSQIVCMGKDVRLTVPIPTTVPNVEYKWLTRHHSTDGSGSGETATLNTIGDYTDVASPTNLSIPGYYTYKLEAKNTLTLCAEVYDYMVYVLPTPVVTLTSPVDLIGCLLTPTETFVLSAATTTPGVSETFDFTYQWYQKTPEDAAATPIIGATSETYTATGLNLEGDYEYFVKVKYVLKDCGEVSSDTKTIKITPAPTRPEITITSN